MKKQIIYNDLIIKGNLFGAPLAGYTNYPTRIVLQEFGADLTFTEMVSADGIVYGDKKTIQLLYTNKQEKIKAVQIFGNDKNILKDAIEYIKTSTPYKLVNLNLGCPIKKILKAKKGGYLLKDMKHLAVIFKYLSTIKDIHLTIKIRAGWDKYSLVYQQIAHLAEENNIKLIIFHPRTVSQMFTGQADWDLIKKLKDTVSIPVIGNGDIFTPEQALQRFQESGCDGIMIGRGFLGNPWIFTQIREYLKTGRYKEYPQNQRIRIMVFHLKKMIKYFGEEQGIKIFRTQMFQYLKKFPYSARIRQEVQLLETLPDLKKAFKKYKLI